jgi:hypothetical protein
MQISPKTIAQKEKDSKRKTEKNTRKDEKTAEKNAERLESCVFAW